VGCGTIFLIIFVGLPLLAVGACVVIGLFGVGMTSLTSTSASRGSSTDAKTTPSESHRARGSTSVSALPSTASQVIALYGAPDVDDSTEHDNPPPPMLSRWMDYRRANVRLLFFPSGRGGGLRRPPIDEWTVVGCVDLAAQKKISTDEAARRLAAIR
jgi:hypothetical protein